MSIYIGGFSVSIIRIVKDKDNPYVMINKEVINNPNLSFKAKGIFTYLMSKPDNWTCQVPDIIKHGTDGKASVYSAIKELRENGYMIKQPIRNDKGVITQWEELIFENPSEEAKRIYQEQVNRRKKSPKETPLSENQEMGKEYEKKPFSENQEVEINPVTENQKMEFLNENPVAENQNMDNLEMDNPDIENREILINNNINNNDINNNDINNKDIDNITPSILFSDIKNKLSNELSLVSLNTWIEPLEVMEANNKLILKAPNKFTKDIIDNKFLNSIKTYSKLPVEVIV